MDNINSIKDLANKYNIFDVTEYGSKFAKINSLNNNKNGKLILVTAINPTPYGEGKTTVTIGLVDALNKLGHNACCCLREPSLGPVFGFKGGACGGGKSQIDNSLDINLHFTGDMHAITSCNNLLASSIDNHIFQGNELGIKKVLFKRCLDINDRSLRDKFNITAASEVMSILCLSKDLVDLKNRLGNIIVGINNHDNFIYAKDLGVNGAMAVLLKDAIKPNLVNTLENSPVIMHGGPFANISLGCNSVIATKTALSNFDYVVTEAGFGADLGAEKFIDIKCRLNNLNLSSVVLVVTERALKYHGGFDNLKAHIDNLKQFNVNIVVCLNKFIDDSTDFIEDLRNFVVSQNVLFTISDSYNHGSTGSIDLANIVISLENKDLKFLYNLEDPVEEKIKKIAYNYYHANDILYLDEAKKMIEIIDKLDLNYPICVAKTQYSISDDKDKLGYPKDYTLTVRNIEILNGARLIVIYLNNIITMPGLPSNPNYLKYDIDDNGNVIVND